MSSALELEALWEAEIIRRMALIESTETQLIPADQVFRELDNLLRNND